MASSGLMSLNNSPLAVWSGQAGWTHGDFHDLQVLWDDGRVSAVLDWDRLGVRRLAAEVAVIQRLAISLCDRLATHDPLSERVHHRKMEVALLSIWAAVPALLRRAA